MARVRITADDYGLDAAVNRAIEALASARAIDGASVMAHADADWSGIPALVATGVDVGAHLVFVEERPLTSGRRMARLLSDGRLPRTWGALFRTLAARPWLVTALVDEAAAQLARLAAAGVPIRFVNSHQHVHLHPLVWTSLRPLVDRAGWSLRAVRAPLRLVPAKQLAVDVAGAASWALAPLRRAGGIRPVGVDAAGRLGPDDARTAARRARGLAGPVELVVHPGEDSPGLAARYAHWGYRWSDELAALASGAVRRALDAGGEESA